MEQVLTCVCTLWKGIMAIKSISVFKFIIFKDCNLVTNLSFSQQNSLSFET
jgi:hypothetical protein